MSQYGPGQHPSSRSNLIPFKDGFDARRRPGAPSLGREITCQMNQLGASDGEGNAIYTEDDLNEIIGDVRASHARCIAAKEILRARLDGFDTIGRVPRAANSIDRLMDRTDGRPTQMIKLEAKTTRTAIEVKADIKALIVADPGIAELLRSTAAPVLAELERPLDSTTEAVSVPEKKRLPAAARKAEDTAIKNIANGKAEAELKDLPEAAQLPDRPVPDDISSWF